MPRKPPSKPKPRDYRHGDKKALLRPESGAQDVFPSAKRKPHKTYRYDSSLSPELAWDEAQARGEGEQLIDEIITSDNLDQARQAAERLKSLSKPFLNWTGKAERGSISVPTLPLFTHERLSTQAVLETLKRHKRDRQKTLDLHGEGNKSIGEKIRGAYEHLNGWQNRLILGDSLQVMNSLLEYEGLGGQVQMVYMDPPYGVKFGGNFQPFVRKRDVKDGDDDSISREPEMVKAYRDTWELGIHSWLTYMRDRLLLAREMLTDSGSCFVQISDENVHLVRSVMDEIFGRENFVNFISYRTSAPLGSKNVPHITDYICWYAKNKTSLKFRRLFTHKGTDDGFNLVETKEGKIKSISDCGELQKTDRLFSSITLVAAGPNVNTIFPVEYAGRIWHPTSGRGWKTTRQGMENIKKQKRFYEGKTVLRYKYYLDDFPYKEITNSWLDTAGASNKHYVVQTTKKVIQRCMLMTTDPGDLVFDPTCGSGTTAVIAEQWGRRWITTDVSRVPLALARQRLLTATYPYYQLKDEKRGPGSGFTYTRKQNKKGEEVGGIVPHITLKSIANNESAEEEVLVDKPEVESKVTRITGPFCVEAVLPTPLSPDISPDQPPGVQEPPPQADDEDDHIPRMIEVLRLSPTVQLPGNNTFDLKNIRPPAKSLNIHAEAKNAAGDEAIAVVFGPANGAISERAVVEAGQEARNKGYARLLVIAFAIEPAARETVEHGEATFGLPTIYAQASTDLAMSDLLKNMRSSQIFSVCGLPDVELRKADEKSDDGGELWQVELRGLDIFDPASMETCSQKGDNVPCWMLDPDYDGQCFRAGQVFFPRTSAWDKIHKEVKADFEDAVWEHLRGSVSAPFIAGEQVAVKVIDDRGNELIVVKKIGRTIK